MAWAGARGPVSLLAAFSIPVVTSTGAPFPARDLLLSVTFGVVVLTLVIATSLGPLVRRLGLEPDDNDELLASARDRAADAAVARLDELVDEAAASGGPRLPPHIVEGLRTTVQHRRKVADRGGLSQTYVQWRQEMLETERAELQRMRDEGELSDVLMRQLLREIDLREGALRR